MDSDRLEQLRVDLLQSSRLELATLVFPGDIVNILQTNVSRRCYELSTLGGDDLGDFQVHQRVLRRESE